MNAKDLMIGDYVRLRDKVLRIDAITEDGNSGRHVNCYDADGKATDYLSETAIRPISLNEERHSYISEGYEGELPFHYVHQLQQWQRLREAAWLTHRDHNVSNEMYLLQQSITNPLRHED